MAVSFVASATGNDATTSATNATCPITVPTVLDNDFAIAAMHYNSNVATITPPAGWTAAAANPYDNGAAHRAWFFYKKLTAAESATTVTFSLSAGSGRFVGIMDVLRGVDTTTPLDATPTTDSTPTTTYTAPSITSVTANAWIYNVWLVKTTTGGPPGPTITVPGTHTARAFSSTNIASGAQLSCRGGTLTTPGAAGAYGAYTATAGFAGVTGHGFSFALRPAATGTPSNNRGSIQDELNRLAGTTGKGIQAAMNTYASTSGVGLQAAMNTKAGTSGKGIQACANTIATTTGKGVVDALDGI